MPVRCPVPCGVPRAPAIPLLAWRYSTFSRVLCAFAARAAKLAPWGELATTKKKDADTASVASEASAEETAAAKPKRLEGKIRVLVSSKCAELWPRTA